MVVAAQKFRYHGTVALNIVQTITDGQRLIPKDILRELIELEENGILPILLCGWPIQKVQQLFDDSINAYPDLKAKLEVAGKLGKNLPFPIAGSGGTTSALPTASETSKQITLHQTITGDALKAFINYCKREHLRFQIVDQKGNFHYPQNVLDLLNQHEIPEGQELHNGQTPPPLKAFQNFCKEHGISYSLAKSGKIYDLNKFKEELIDEIIAQRKQRAYSASPLSSFQTFCEQKQLQCTFSTNSQRLLERLQTYAAADNLHQKLFDYLSRQQELNQTTIYREGHLQLSDRLAIAHDQTDITNQENNGTIQYIEDQDLADLQACQLGAFSFDKSELVKLRKYMEQLGVKAMDTGQGNYFEFAPTGRTKGIAYSEILDWLKAEKLLDPNGTRHYGIGKSQTDISFLEMVPIGHRYGVITNAQNTKYQQLLKPFPPGTIHVPKFDQGPLEALQKIKDRVKVKVPQYKESSQQKKLFVFNLNQILEKDGTISLENATAIDDLQKSYIDVVLVSDIPFTECQAILDATKMKHSHTRLDLGCHHICASGAEVYKFHHHQAEHEKVLCKPLDNQLVKERLEQLYQSKDIPFFVDTADGKTFVPEGFASMFDADQAQFHQLYENEPYQSAFDQALAQARSLKEQNQTITNIEEFISENKGNVLQIRAFSLGPRIKEKAADRPCFLSIVSNEKGRSAGLYELQDKLSLDDSGLVVVYGGKAPCDIELMELPHVTSLVTDEALPETKLLLETYEKIRNQVTGSQEKPPQHHHLTPEQSDLPAVAKQIIAYVQGKQSEIFASEQENMPNTQAPDENMVGAQTRRRRGILTKAAEIGQQMLTQRFSPLARESSPTKEEEENRQSR